MERPPHWLKGEVDALGELVMGAEVGRSLTLKCFVLWIKNYLIAPRETIGAKLGYLGFARAITFMDTQNITEPVFDDWCVA